MDRNTFITTIKNEIVNGELTLKLFENLQPASSKESQSGFNMALIAGVVHYDKKNEQLLTTTLFLWERRVKEILKLYFGTSRTDVVDEFVVSQPEKWMDFKRNGTSSIRKNLNVLRSIIDRLQYIEALNKNTDAGST